MNKRSVFCEDAIQWLETREVQLGCSLVSSMPDISEFPGYSLADWKNWFINTATLILSKTAPEGVTIFYQSDIKFEGTWVDKGYLCQKAAEAMGHELLWHKIICRSPAGIATFGRPAYSHMLCFSKNLKADISKSTPDVIPDLGDKTWQRGMGLEACLMAAKFIAEQTPSKTIINPFCGEGSMLAAASVYELEGIGIERSPKRAEKARRLELIKEKSGWAFNE
jgi:hypothetical protein